VLFRSPLFVKPLPVLPQVVSSKFGRAEALRQTMIGLMDGKGYVDSKTGKAVYSYAHPLFWAPFTIVGDGQGTRPGA